MIIKGLLFIAIAICIATGIDIWSQRRKDKRRSSPRYTEPARTGEHRWVPVDHDGSIYLCMQTQWEKWRVDEGYNGERMVYWEWSTMREINEWKVRTDVQR